MWLGRMVGCSLAASFGLWLLWRDFVADGSALPVLKKAKIGTGLFLKSETTSAWQTCDYCGVSWWFTIQKYQILHDSGLRVLGGSKVKQHLTPSTSHLIIHC